MTRIPWTLLAVALLAAPPLARAGSIPTSTDEARSLAARSLPREVAAAAVKPGSVAMTTDEARVLARAALPNAPSPARAPIVAVASTDDARAVAGGLLAVVPPAKRQLVAHCGASCPCAHR
jgi:hypothetical protein